MKLVIGNKNYSTWSLRPWLLLEAFNVAYEEVQESLRDEGLTERFKQYSDSARVPVLIDDGLPIWDSLAICEYINDNYLANIGWPTDVKDKAIARAICAEMHSGFSALRSEMPMNCRAKRHVDLSPQALADIARIDAIWSHYAREDSDGNLRLFGQFSIADCFFAPVAFRFVTYRTKLTTAAQNYADSLIQHNSMQKWLTGALSETEIIDCDEAGTDI